MGLTEWNMAGSEHGQLKCNYFTFILHIKSYFTGKSSFWFIFFASSENSCTTLVLREKLNGTFSHPPKPAPQKNRGLWVLKQNFLISSKSLVIPVYIFISMWPNWYTFLQELNVLLFRCYGGPLHCHRARGAQFLVLTNSGNVKSLPTLKILVNSGGCLK